MQTPETLKSNGATQTQAAPSPARILDTLLYSYARVEALKAAIGLELFTAVAEGARSAAEIVRRCGAAERGIRTLCDFLVVNGFLTKTEKAYDLADDAPSA